MLTLNHLETGSCLWPWIGLSSCYWLAQSSHQSSLLGKEGTAFCQQTSKQAIAENYKFLKNDILKVDVVLLVDMIYKRIGIKPHTVNELMELVKNVHFKDFLKDSHL